MFNKVTAVQKEKNCHKFLFNAKGRLSMIYAFQQQGIDIRMTSDCTHACACFDNLIDYNKFKSTLESLHIATA